jgi:2-C-methyl-D-erythritol 4-phosphate cytidylyltransferase
MSHRPMRYWLVMPAAGVGRRFGTATPKQYAALHGRTVIEWALYPFLVDPSCAGAMVVLATDDPFWPVIGDRLDKLPGRKADVLLAQGGAERCHTVRNGLAALRDVAERDDWVLVHDAARPCLASEDLQSLLDRLGSHPVGGLLATPAADTLKRAAAKNEVSGLSDVEQTVDRSALWRALTPQMFRYEMLCDALDRALATSRVPTDEAQAVEWTGQRPVLVPGSAANIKITSADDLVLAGALLSARATGPVTHQERSS